MQNLALEKVIETDSFDAFKISKMSFPGFIIVAIFKVKKVNKTIVEELHKTIQEYKSEAIGLFLDISIVDSIAPNVLDFNAEMIKSLENGSTIQRVGICAGKFTALAFKALMKLKKPKVATKVFDKEELALNFTLNIEIKK